MTTKTPITLTQIAKQLHMTAKSARRKLRNNDMKKPKSGWQFTPAQRTSVVKVLRA